MYQPPHFREDDPEPLQAFIRAHPLGLLISHGSDGLTANPIPFVLHAEEAQPTLRCHLARANPQWRQIAESAEVLVVFQGAEHYITPAWYPSKAEHGKVVPTWNFAAVEARGRAAVIEDLDWLRAHVTALTNQSEAARPQPWELIDAPDAFVAAQLKGIVGLEIPIAALAGKFKASQNRPPADRAGVVAGLEAEGNARALAMRDLVKARNGL